jgi:hypothetical protein
VISVPCAAALIACRNRESVVALGVPATTRAARGRVWIVRRPRHFPEPGPHLFDAKFVPVRLAFTWLGTGKTLLPEQRETAARAFHADRELLSATKLIPAPNLPSQHHRKPASSRTRRR